MTIIRASYPRTYLTLSIHFPRLLKEFASLDKKENTCQIENNNGSATVLNVGRNKRMESFLSCGIPELHSECFIIDIDGFGYEINSNSGLNLGKNVPVNFR